MCKCTNTGIHLSFKGSLNSKYPQKIAPYSTKNIRNSHNGTGKEIFFISNMSFHLKNLITLSINLSKTLISYLLPVFKEEILIIA